MASNQTKRQQQLERQAKAAVFLKQQEAQNRRRRILTYGLSAVAALGVVGGLGYLSQHKSTPGEPSKGAEVAPLAITGGKTTTERAATVVADTSGITGVVAYDSTGYPSGTADKDALPHAHVLGPVVYSVTPPVGGDHYGVWMNCGIYTEPVPNERAVHSLEHGAVWITYRPGLAPNVVTALQDLVLTQSKRVGGNRFMDLSPWTSDALPSPIVVTAWAHQLEVDSATDPRIQQFIDAFRAKKGITPELGAACNGIEVDQGGRPVVS